MQTCLESGPYWDSRKAMRPPAPEVVAVLDRLALLVADELGLVVADEVDHHALRAGDALELAAVARLAALDVVGLLLRGERLVEAEHLVAVALAGLRRQLVEEEVPDVAAFLAEAALGRLAGLQVQAALECGA
jgi:hypothetical protein